MTTTTDKPPLFVRIGNIFTTPLLRSGLRLVGFGRYPAYLLTVRGRTSGLPRTVPIVLIHRHSKRIVASPYGHVNWVRNLQSAGEATLTRGRHAEAVKATQLEPEEAALILREDVRDGNPFARFFGVTKDSSLDDFKRAVVSHPMFALESR